MHRCTLSDLDGIAGSVQLATTAVLVRSSSPGRRTPPRRCMGDCGHSTSFLGRLLARPKDAVRLALGTDLSRPKRFGEHCAAAGSFREREQPSFPPCGKATLLEEKSVSGRSERVIRREREPRN